MEGGEIGKARRREGSRQGWVRGEDSSRDEGRDNGRQRERKDPVMHMHLGGRVAAKESSQTVDGDNEACERTFWGRGETTTTPTPLFLS